jgi:hypothetical protein
VIALSPMLSTVVMQDRVAAPSTCTVQAPHRAWPAAELGPGHTEHVAQHPQERGVAVDIDLMGCAVDLVKAMAACLCGWG